MSRDDERGIPKGYVASVLGRATLVAQTGLENEIRAAGLDRPDGWEARLREAAIGSGRGATVVLNLPSGRAARLKRLRRGGWAARLWSDHFAGKRRPLDNLRLPAEAGRRGLATPSALALLTEQTVPGLFRAWLATEELADTIDLGSAYRSAQPPTHAELGAAVGLVRRMHDLGVEHRDLNLGNLLIRRGAEPVAFVIDLDRARLCPSPLGFALRQRALRRLERSYVKSCGAAGASEEIRGSLYSLYAADDRVLAGRLEQGRSAGRMLISLHRLGW